MNPRSAEGFTLIELLVVTAIIGILAAIALPTFARQADLGQDAAAKSDAAVLASLVEVCVVEEVDYRRCDTALELTNNHGLGGFNWGNGVGQVRVDQSAQQTFRVTGRSHTGNLFRIRRNGAGVLIRRCTSTGRAGCPSNGRW